MVAFSQLGIYKKIKATEVAFIFFISYLKIFYYFFKTGSKKSSSDIESSFLDVFLS